MKRAMAGVLFGLAAAALTVGPGAAEEPDEKALKRAERDYEQAVRYARRGKAKSALASYEKALPYRNDSSDIFFNLVQVCEAAKAWEKLALYAQGFLFMEPDGSDAKQIERTLKSTWRRLAARKLEPVPIVFDITPEGTDVRVDHVPLSSNKVTEVMLLPGTYQATATRQDHEPWSTTLVVEAATPQTIKGALKAKVYTGKLAVKTTPAEGIKVFVDDKFVGTTPLEAPIELATLKYLVRFEAPGYDKWSRYVTIRKDETHELKPVLERTALKPAK